MQLFTVWGIRNSEPDEPELMVAWDEFSVDANPKGFDSEVKKAIESWGSDLRAHRYITVNIPDKAVFDAFVQDEVEGTVVTK